jgi:5-methylcytosine-specific restriction protein B
MVTNRPQSEGPSLEDLSEETHVPIEELTDLLDILEEKQQVIFEGPPGSGKTYIAEKLARYVSENQLSGEHDSRFNIVQFHQSYGYEDFVQGIRPITGSDGNLSYELRDGIFKRFCDTAADDPDGKHVIVIDEINRGDVSRILGELLLLFEYRDKSIDLAYSGPNDLRFSIPPNVYILGTMNTADRSLTQIDYALRRRFYFYRLIPVVNGEAAVLARWLDSELFDAEAKGQILDLFIKLNQRIDELLGENYQIGHSFFMVKGIDQFAVQERVFQRAILPLLEEYFHNHRNRREVVSGFQRQELLSSGTTSDDE